MWLECRTLLLNWDNIKCHFGKGFLTFKPPYIDPASCFVTHPALYWWRSFFFVISTYWYTHHDNKQSCLSIYIMVLNNHVYQYILWFCVDVKSSFLLFCYFWFFSDNSNLIILWFNHYGDQSEQKWPYLYKGHYIYMKGIINVFFLFHYCQISLLHFV